MERGVDGGDDSPVAVVHGRGDRPQALLELLVDEGEALAADAEELGPQALRIHDRARRVRDELDLRE